jgi:hypothetical protein
MQAALISYAVFTAIFLLLIMLLVIIIGVRSLLESIRRRRGKEKMVSRLRSSRTWPL